MFIGVYVVCMHFFINGIFCFVLFRFVSFRLIHYLFLSGKVSILCKRERGRDIIYVRSKYIHVDIYYTDVYD